MLLKLCLMPLTQSSLEPVDLARIMLGHARVVHSIKCISLQIVHNCLVGYICRLAAGCAGDEVGLDLNRAAFWEWRGRIRMVLPKLGLDLRVD